MRTPSVLVTGASGEIGHGLINQLARTGRSIVTVDIAPLEPAMARQVRREFTGSITDKWIVERLRAALSRTWFVERSGVSLTHCYARSRRWCVGGVHA